MLTAVPSPSKLVARCTVDRILVATAILWCRDLTFPTARAVAAAAGVAPSTVVSAFGGMAPLVDALVAVEVDRLLACAAAPDATLAFRRRVADLRAHDPVLARLPWLVSARSGDPRLDDCGLVLAAAECMHARDHGSGRA